MCFGEQVLGIGKSESGIIVRSQGSNEEAHNREGRNLLVAPGGSPRLPPSLLHLGPSPNIIHTSVYALEIDRVISTIASSPGTSRRIAVLGSGQSAAEVFLNLQSRLASLPLTFGNLPHQVDLIIRRGSLKPSDDSPFANEIFDPKSTDFIYNLPSRAARLEVKREYETTNYGVVNPKTIDAVCLITFVPLASRLRPFSTLLFPFLDIRSRIRSKGRRWGIWARRTLIRCPDSSFEHVTLSIHRRSHPRVLFSGERTGQHHPDITSYSRCQPER